jgi:putative transposase
LCLPPSYTWTLKGRAYQHRVPTRWGKQGRINLMGTLCFLEGESEQYLEYRLLEDSTSCRSGEVVAYLNLLAKKARKEGKPVAVVLDRAPFHRAKVVRDERARWEAKGLKLYYLPA